MELAYYRLIFDNQREFLVETEIDELDALVRKIDRDILMNKKEYISLQLSETSDPVLIRSARLFSVQRARDISPQSKKWRLL